MSVLLLLTSSRAFSIDAHHESEHSNAQEMLSAWELVQAPFTPRHESGLVYVNNKLYLIGGRGNKPIEIFDPVSGKWTVSPTKMPLEMHHFQPLALNNKVYIIGAFTGAWPNENGIADVLSFDTNTSTWSKESAIPQDRVRGAASAVIYKDDIYMIGGITNGHMSGSVTWFDKYDPKTKTFQTLSDAPIARDHAQAAIVGDKLYVMGGRKTSRATGDDFNLTTSEVDVYDFNAKSWTTLPASSNLPTPRAGANVVVVDNQIILIGGESASQKSAHAEVEVFDTTNQTWSQVPALQVGRHSGGAASYTTGNEQKIIVLSGSGNRGGSPELSSQETVSASALYGKGSLAYNSEVSLFKTFSAHLQGPEVSENDEINPFTQYLAIAKITAPTGLSQYVRGFFVGDGKAQYSSSDSGALWRFNYTPSSTGSYSFEFSLFSGADVGFKDIKAAKALLSGSSSEAKRVAEHTGTFSVVTQTPSAGSTFEQNGFLGLKNGYHYFPRTQQYWLKIGANSPENFLAYWELDGTYRISAQNREGEASTGENLHYYKSHVSDYQKGDPLWGEYANKGKGIIGAINYLAAQGMNTQYFLTMNINGDGKDVFPYVHHEDFERFDISKLAQWEMIFSHMQDKGILLHFVTQETENEMLLDNGDTGKMRSLYYSELIARFAHHKAIVWNMGEENGPANFSPNGQNDEQRIAMAAFFEQNDPYGHTVLVHSHSTKKSKDEILPPLYNSDYDGISFQINFRHEVFSQIAKWRELSAKGNKRGPWLISMDEIGMWWTGAKVDADDPNHDSLRRDVLWPAFFANSAGVEWYAGGRQPQNDLGLEDFRTRQSLWKQSAIAQQFLSKHVPLWEMSPVFYPLNRQSLIEGLDDKPDETYPAASVYAAKSSDHFIAYVIEQDQVEFEMPSGPYQMIMLDPISGEILKSENLILPKMLKHSINGPDNKGIKDWVLLLKSSISKK